MTASEPTVVLGVGAGAATFKAVALASLLTRSGFRVRVLMTEASCAFVAPLSFQAVTGTVPVTDWRAIEPDGVATHLVVAEARAFVVVPATADLIGRLANGLASDPVTLGALSAPDLRFVCPAMNDRMWANAIVQENVARLEAHGWRRIGPVVGRLAEGYDAIGRMSEPEDILADVLEALDR